MVAKLQAFLFHGARFTTCLLREAVLSAAGTPPRRLHTPRSACTPRSAVRDTPKPPHAVQAERGLPGRCRGDSSYGRCCPLPALAEKDHSRRVRWSLPLGRIPALREHPSSA